MELAEAAIAITGVLSVVVGAATAYLRLFVGHRLARLEADLAQRYVDLELCQAHRQPLAARVKRLETEG